MESETNQITPTYCIPSSKYNDKCYELFKKIGTDERSELWLAKRTNRATAFSQKNPLGKRDGLTY